MLRFEQLDFTFALRGVLRTAPPATVGKAVSFPSLQPTIPGTTLRGRDPKLEAVACDLLRNANAAAVAARVRVEWHPRLRTAAGRASYHRTLVLLNPRLQPHGAAEIDRTLRHELAHLLAQHRARRRRIAPHGAEWRQACRDLGIADEQRCHTLPFPIARRARRWLYRCPNCARDFPRVRRIRRASACSDCCRRLNGGKFAKDFQLLLVRRASAD